MSKTLTFAQILSSPVLLPPSFLARGSSLWSLLASMVVPQQLSQKAFEKLATNQDLSNAIEKVSKDDEDDDYVDFYSSLKRRGARRRVRHEVVRRMLNSTHSIFVLNF